MWLWPVGLRRAADLAVLLDCGRVFSRRVEREREDERSHLITGDRIYSVPSTVCSRDLHYYRENIIPALKVTFSVCRVVVGFRT